MQCWGELGPGPTSLTGPFTSLSSGYTHVCGRRNDGSVACLGANGIDQASAPVGAFDRVEVGSAHTCGLDTTGAIVCWGAD